jgi:hypothetical protein
MQQQSYLSGALLQTERLVTGAAFTFWNAIAGCCARAGSELIVQNMPPPMRCQERSEGGAMAFRSATHGTEGICYVSIWESSPA